MITIQVHGRPAPQGSKRHVGKGILVESSKKVKPWREAVKFAVLEENEHNLKFVGPTKVDIGFHFRPPKSAKKGSKPITRGTGDIDKLVRSTLDALVDSGLLADDSIVVELYASKRHTLEFEGAFITVSPW